MRTSKTIIITSGHSLERRSNISKDSKDATSPSYSPSPSVIISFASLIVDHDKKLISDSPTKQSDLEAWLTWLMKDSASGI